MIKLQKTITTILHAPRFAFASQPTLRLPSFSHFPLHKTIHSFLQGNNIHTPTYIQYAFLASLAKKQNRTFHLTSPTGSGKTLSYFIPLANELKMQEQGKGILTVSQRPRALILTHNKELVLQCRNVGKSLSHHCKLKVEGINIGRSMSEQKQIINNGVDVLVSTFQRLVPLIKRKQIFLSHLRWVVVDEVDTLFETGKLTQIMKDLLVKGKSVQQEKDLKIVLTGTTHPQRLTKYIKQELGTVAQIIDRNSHMNLHNIKHEFRQCPELDKHQTLQQTLYQRRDAKTLIFCNTVNSLHELQYFLTQKGLTPLTLHSDLHKQARLQNYQLFRDTPGAIMISTDLGARGLDIPELERVINYDFPLSTCDYLQRAGRTGRAGKQGQVVTLYHKKNMDVINELKNASFDQPLKINNSAYAMQNREQLKKKAREKTNST